MTSTHYPSLFAGEFRDVSTGKQRSVCLRAEGGLAEGDQLVLREARPDGTHTGAWLMRRVTHVLAGEGLATGYCIYSLSTAADNERAIVAMKRHIGLAERQGVSADKLFRIQERREAARRAILRKSAERVARVRRREPVPEAGR